MKYRYELGRVLALDREPAKVIGFLMLNPSTADHEIVDPTVRKCIHFAEAWGYSRLLVGNIFALRSTNPKALYKHPDPVGPYNDAQILGMFDKCQMVVAAWGRHGALLHRGHHVRNWVCKHLPLYHLGLNGDGTPKHPLYLKNSTQPIRWK